MGVFSGFDVSGLRKGARDVSPDGRTTPEEPPVRFVRVLAATTDDVPRVAEEIGKVLGADDPGGLSVATSGDFAALREAISGDLGRFGRGLVFVVLAAGMLLGMLNTSALILMRRRDLGRRRALGATRSFLVTLLVLQSILPSVLGAMLGAMLGCLGAVVVLEVSQDPLPQWRFYLALVLLTMLTSAFAALGPSISAAWRDPIKVLRQP